MANEIGNRNCLMRLDEMKRSCSNNHDYLNLSIKLIILPGMFFS